MPYGFDSSGNARIIAFREKLGSSSISKWMKPDYLHLLTLSKKEFGHCSLSSGTPNTESLDYINTENIKISTVGRKLSSQHIVSSDPEKEFATVVDGMTRITKEVTENLIREQLYIKSIIVDTKNRAKNQPQKKDSTENKRHHFYILRGNNDILALNKQ